MQLTKETSDVSDATLAGLRATAAQAEDAGLRVEFGDQAFQDTTFGITITEALGVIFAAVVLIITFTAGSAVIFAGITVIIALLGLLVVGIPFLSVMGVAAAVAVLVSIAVSVTLVPAMLGLAKDRLIPKPGSRAYRRAHAADGDAEAKPSMGMP